MKSYRITIHYHASSDEEARRDYQDLVTAAASLVPLRYRVTFERQGYRNAVLSCLKWGSLIGLCAAIWKLYCVASGCQG